MQRIGKQHAQDVVIGDLADQGCWRGGIKASKQKSPSTKSLKLSRYLVIVLVLLPDRHLVYRWAAGSGIMPSMASERSDNYVPWLYEEALLEQAVERC